MIDPNDNVEIGEDKYSWGQKGGSLKEIVLRHISKLSDISSQELVAGYWDEKPMTVGNTVAVVKSYHPDLREAYINSVDFLLILVRHCIAEDSAGNFKDKLEEIKKKEKKSFETATKEQWNNEDWVSEKLLIKKELMEEIMLMLDRIQFFSGDDGGINE